jgi:hypothetical protein
MKHRPSPSRPGRPLNLTASAIMAASLLLLSAQAVADTFTLTAEVSYFRSWIDAGNANANAMVNGIVLTDSGLSAGSYQGSGYNWSNVVNLAPGTASIDFGYDITILDWRRMNNFSVAVAQASVTPAPLANSNFDLAHLSFTNGQWFFHAEVGVQFIAHDVDTGADYVYQDVVLITSNNSSPDPITHLFDPLLEADMFVLQDHPEFGSVRVYEAVAQPTGNPGVTGGGTLQAHIGSLDPVGYSSAYGAAFLDSSVTPIPSTSAVPEPASVAMLIAGLGVLLGGQRRLRGRGA